MDTPLNVTQTATPPARRQSLSVLSKWTVATLAAAVVMLIWLQATVALVSQYWFFALVLGLPAVAAAVPIVVTRWRWAPLFGVLYWILLNGSAFRRIPYDITHPEDFNTFAFTVVVNALGVVGIVAGVGATVQNYRAPTAAETEGGHRRAPKWFMAGVWTLAGVCLGALLIGALPRADDTIGVSPEALAALPALEVVGPEIDGLVGGFQYNPPELRVKLGEIVALRLENLHDDLGHSFNIDEFNLHISMPPGKHGLVLFQASTSGTYTYYCGLPGHSESGTLIVEP